MVLIFLMYAISASTFMIGKNLLIYSTPIFITGCRTLFAGLCYFLYLRVTNQPCFHKDYLFECLRIALFSFYLSNICKFWALKYVASEMAAVLSTTEPLFAVLFSYVMCLEKMTIGRWAGLFLCMGGSLAHTFHYPFNGMSAFDGYFGLLPMIILILSIIFSSYGALCMRQLIITNNCSVALVSGISMFSAGVLALATSLLLEHPFQRLTVDTTGSFIESSTADTPCFSNGEEAVSY